MLTVLFFSSFLFFSSRFILFDILLLIIGIVNNEFEVVLSLIN